MKEICEILENRKYSTNYIKGEYNNYIKRGLRSDDGYSSLQNIIGFIRCLVEVRMIENKDATCIIDKLICMG